MKKNSIRFAKNASAIIILLTVVLSSILAYGANGYKWSMRFSDDTTFYGSVIKAGSDYIAVGDGGIIDYFFSDGEDLGYKTDIKDDFYDAAFNGKKYIIVGDLATIITSADRYEWEKKDIDCLGAFKRVIWNGKKFIIIGAPNSGGTGSTPADRPQPPILTSNDGDNWAVQKPNIYVCLSDIAWSGKRFAAVGAAGTIITSSDGVKWIKQKSNTSEDISAVIWNGKKFLAVSGNCILTSPDGTKWTVTKSNIPEGISSIAWNGKQYMAVGSEGTVVSSSDGLKWTKEAANTGSASMKKIIWDGKYFVAVGDQCMIMTQ